MLFGFAPSVTFLHAVFLMDNCDASAEIMSVSLHFLSPKLLFALRLSFAQAESVVHIHILGAHLPHCKASLLAQHNIYKHAKPQKRNILYGILTAMRLKPTVTWEVLFCSLVHEYWRFGVKYCTRIHLEVHRYIYARSSIFIDLKTWSNSFLLTLGTYPSNCIEARPIRQISVIYIFHPYQKPHTLGNKWIVAMGYKIWVSFGVHYFILKILMCFCACGSQLSSYHPSQWRTQEFCSRGGGSKNSVEDRGQRTGIWGR